MSLKDKAKSREAGETKELRQQVRELQSVIDQQQQHIERMKSSSFKMPVAKPVRPRGGFCRVIVSDTHGSRIDKAAAATFLSDLAILQPSEVIMLGDHLDCGGFLAQHWTLGYVAETDYTFEQDVAAANVFLDSVQAAAPKAAFHYLLGNHEDRLERWCCTQALKSNIDAAYLFNLFSPETVLNIPKRGINLYKRNESYGLRSRGAIRLGKCIFTHGHRHGLHAARHTLADYGHSVVFGHVHRISSFTQATADTDIGAWCCGCLCELMPMWRHTSPTNWNHGYGVQLVRKTGEFLHITVPIINGQSYLMQLTEQLQ